MKTTQITRSTGWRALVVSTLAACTLSAGAAVPLSANNAITARNAPGSTADGGSYQPIVSGDGRYVVFLSAADNLVTNDNVSPFLDVFVHDLLTTNTVLVSVSSSGASGGNENSFVPSISSNGQFVAFSSVASNLVENDDNNGSDIFLRNIVSGTTTLVSVDRAGDAARDPSPFGAGVLSSNPQISPDGRFIAFESRATNLTATADDNIQTDVFVRDLQTGVTRLVSVSFDGTSTANGRSDSYRMTPDGRYVAFVSTATNLTFPGTTNRLGEIYVRDTHAGVTYWCSTNAGPLSSGSSGTGAAQCRNPVISTDGTTVVFAESLYGSVLCYSLVSNTLTRLGSFGRMTHKSAAPQISSDGRYVAYPEGHHQTRAIQLLDRATGSNIVVASGYVLSHLVGMTPDARYITFLGTNGHPSGVTNPALFGLNGLVQAFIHDAVEGTTRMITVGTNGAGANRGSEIALPAISPDGRRVIFESSATDLVSEDHNDSPDVFRRDMGTNWRAVAISRGIAELQTKTGTFHTEVWPGSLSPSGNLVVITSGTASPQRTNDFPKLFLRNLQTQMSVAIDPATNFWGAAVHPAVSSNGAIAFAQRSLQVSGGGLRRDATFYWDASHAAPALISPPRNDGLLVKVPVFSADGKLMAFETMLPAEQVTLSPDGNQGRDVFVRDLVAGTNVLVSQSYSSPRSLNGESFNATISPNGRWVAFQSWATDVEYSPGAGGVSNPGPVGLRDGLFMRDLSLHTNRLVSYGSNYAEPATGPGLFSGNSEWIAYGLTNARIFVRNLLSGERTQVCHGCTNAVLNYDAQYVAYEQFGGSGPRQVLLRNVRTGVERLLSAGTDGESGNADSISPQMTPDGRYIVFQSKASNLTENDTNGFNDIFLADRITGARLLVSLNRNGTGPGDGPSSHPVLSADGRVLVFQSFASDLIDRDYNDHRDVFVARLSTPDSDGDGMDDDFEVAYFGNLNRDGTADFDNDGQTDGEEFRAGTNPAADASVLRVITVSNAEGGAKSILWSAVAGRAYRVQYKDDLDEAWKDLPGIVTAANSTGSKADVENTAAGRRFYRVLLAE